MSRTVRAVAPAEREQLWVRAERARALRDEITALLSAEERAWLAAAPVARFVDAMERRPRFHDYWAVGRDARAAWGAAMSAGGEAWMRTFARLALLEAIARTPRTTPSLNVPEMAWPSVEEGMAAVLEAVPGYALTGLDDHDWLKDVAVAQLRMIPFAGIITGAARIRISRMAADAPWSERVSLLRLLGADYFRTRVYTMGHAWREFSEQLRAEAYDYRQAFRRHLYALNPEARGMAMVSWFNDPALREISPRLYERTEYYLSLGGVLCRVANGERTEKQALATSETRRRAHAEGRYQPQQYAVVIKREPLE